MRITPQVLPPTQSPETLGRAIRAKAFTAGSVETPDILEISSIGNLAASLGATGIQALQSLTANVSEPRLEGFLNALGTAGLAGDRISSIFQTLAGFAELADPPDPRTVMDGIEQRGISGNLEYLDRLDNLFDLGYRDVPAIFSAGNDLSDEEFEVYLDSLTRLIRNGVVGTVTIEFRGEPKTVFIGNEIGSDYSRAPLYPRRIGTSAFPV